VTGSGDVTRRGEPNRTDVLVVSVGSTAGWRAAASALASSIERAGVSVEIATAKRAPRVRTFALTDLVEARVAREAALRGIAEYDPAAIIYCSITAALLWPRPGAVWLDSIAAENRPGRHGIWQRLVERRRLKHAPLVLVWSSHALEPLSGEHADVVVVPPPVEGSAPPGPRDIAAITYAGDPQKRRLEYVLESWSRARLGDESLLVAGADGIAPRDGVQSAGRLTPAEFRALLARSRTFVAAPRREDFGIAALEALAHGCRLVTTPSPGPYPARDLARQLDARLVTDDLARGVRIALDDPAPGYAQRAAALLEPFRPEVVDRTVEHDVLPRLLRGFAVG
jgi:glycosyltransferase involved in cell wall biosynthesis